MKYIKLTNSCLQAMIDDSDEDLVNQYKWRVEYARRKKYIATGCSTDKNNPHLFLHQLLIGTKGVDHKDNNTLNNCRDNLRTATQSQNMANRGKQRNNTTGFKGVFREPSNGRIFAKIGFKGRSIRLGTFNTLEEAASAYDKAALSYFGEFAYLNFPLETVIKV
jgi:hypothetical protein